MERRSKQIADATIKFLEDVTKGDMSKINPSDALISMICYAHGANWADEHPDRKLITRILQLRNEFLDENVEEGMIEYIEEKLWEDKKKEDKE